MKECAKVFLQKRGYIVNDNALRVIKMCDDWYSNRCVTDFHMRKNLNGVEHSLNRMNFAKRCCSDDANLCEIVSVVPEQKSEAGIFIKRLLENNRFNVRYREQLEQVSATGTAGAYIYLRDASYVQNAAGNISVNGGRVCINYVEADCIIPLTVENKLVTECAFCATNTVRGKERTTLVIFIKEQAGEKELYKAETVVFDESGEEMPEFSSIIQLGEMRPFPCLRQ